MTEGSTEGDHLDLLSEVDLSDDIDFEWLGKAVLAAALRPHMERLGTSAESPGGHHEVDASVQVRVRVDPPSPTMRPPVVCCICVNDEGIIICRGACCADW